MAILELADLTRLLQESAGADESIDLSGDVLDSSFFDLGYDSLALLQVVGVIQREYGVTLPDDAVAAETPREFLALVNGVPAETAVA
ncbi:acyl carrier protein [Kitasatospora terrestris]|uniref:Acyl carrier protein n=1 Tax=Kitasatospora terrestris TaxID=258051 RepID=A0ABP9DPL9_9ACTN